MEIVSVIRRYRAIAAALVVGIVLLAFVFAGKLEPSRAAITIGLCWVLAMHSADNSAVKEELRREIVAAHAAGITSLRAELLDAVKGLATAGVEWRCGQKQAAVGTLEQVADRITRDVKLTQAQRGT